MNRAFIMVSQELLKEGLHLPDGMFLYASEYEPSCNSFKFYFTGPVANDTPEGFPTEQHELTITKE
jgi:hypothetical protein